MHFRRIYLLKSFSSGFVQTFAALYFSPRYSISTSSTSALDGIGRNRAAETRFVFDLGKTTTTTLGSRQFVWANATRACSAFALSSFKRKAAVSSSLPLPL